MMGACYVELGYAERRSIDEWRRLGLGCLDSRGAAVHTTPYGLHINPIYYCVLGITDLASLSASAIGTA